MEEDVKQEAHDPNCNLQTLPKKEKNNCNRDAATKPDAANCVTDNRTIRHGLSLDLILHPSPLPTGKASDL
jgi:hypothetical protein